MKTYIFALNIPKFILNKYGTFYLDISIENTFQNIAKWSKMAEKDK